MLGRGWVELARSGVTDRSAVSRCPHPWPFRYFKKLVHQWAPAFLLAGQGCQQRVRGVASCPDKRVRLYRDTVAKLRTLGILSRMPLAAANSGEDLQHAGQRPAAPEAVSARWRTPPGLHVGRRSSGSPWAAGAGLRPAAASLMRPPHRGDEHCALKTVALKANLSRAARKRVLRHGLKVNRV
jgi:hypothetical protein